ncbi:putative membrane protein [Clostridioides difficile F480]|nr:putative membrane protein [Clostridioides difficile F480]
MISREPFLVLSTFILIYSNVKHLNIFLILRITKMLTKKYN